MRGEDSIIPPGKTMELECVKGLLCESVDIRESIVVDLRAQILRKTYKFEAEHVAERIMQHGLYILTGSEMNSSHAP